MNQPTASRWGTVTIGANVGAAPVHQIFTQPGLYSATGLNKTLQIFRSALVCQLMNQEPMTKAMATAIAGDFHTMVNHIVHFVARTPSMVSGTGGISYDNARFLASKVRASIAATSHAGAQFAPLPIAWTTTQVVSATWARTISSIANVADASGNIRKQEIDCSSGHKVQYYPTELIGHVMRIQSAYDALPISTTASGALSRILGPTLMAQLGGMNGVLGRFHGLAPILNHCVFTGRDPIDFRRDGRAVFEANGQVRQMDNSVIALSTQAMRAVLSSALEMSIVLGEVRREVKEKDKNAAGTPGGVTHIIGSNSAFADIVQLALTTKKYYNPMGIKDMAAYEQRGLGALGIHADIPWKSMVSAQRPFQFNTASVVLEIETRIRISDMNNNLVCVVPGEQVAPPRPDKKVKAADFTYFMKNPQQIIEACANMNNVDTFDKLMTLGMRQETSRRVGTAYIESGNDFAATRRRMNDLRIQILNCCDRISQIHLTNVISASIANTSASDAVVDKPFRR